MATSGARRSRKTKASEVTAFPAFNPDEFTEFGNRNLEIATRATRAFFGGASDLNREMMSFVNARVKKDLESARALMSAKTGEAAFHAQAEFVEGAIRDYADEASKLMHMTADMARETLAPVEERTEEVLHSIDERAEAQAAAGK